VFYITLIYYLNLGDKDVAGDVRKLLDQIDVIDRGYFGKDRQK